MSYDLNLQFDPGINVKEFLQYFAQRKYFTAGDKQVTYQNPDTGVAFFIDYEATAGLFAAKRVVRAHLEVNYFRPSFFGVETEIELTALVAQFATKIEDPQMQGMADGPYSGAGFLKGWNFGNAFAVKAHRAGNPSAQILTMPQEKLQTAWRWNYQ